jgi:hypothetical protein
MPSHNWLNIIQTAAVLGTLGVLIWYTIETAGLRRAANKQIDISLRPYLIIDMDSRWIRNVGHSPALNIQIDEVILEDRIIRFKKYPIIEPSKNEIIDFIVVGKQDPPNSGYQSQHSFEIIGSDYILSIRYSNLENVRYVSKIRLLKNYRRADMIETRRAE